MKSAFFLVKSSFFRKLSPEPRCASMWGPYFPKLFAQHLDKLAVTKGAASCALSHVDAWCKMVVSW